MASVNDVKLTMGKQLGLMGSLGKQNKLDGSLP
jgi:hypothetical protein